MDNIDEELAKPFKEAWPLPTVIRDWITRTMALTVEISIVFLDINIVYGIYN